MNLQWIGALLVIACCGGVGFSMALHYKRELDGLRQLIGALDFMSCELQYRLTPLPELCRKTAELCAGSIKAVFLALAVELESQISPDVASCMTAARGKIPELPQKTSASLETLGHSLGLFDLEGQLKGLEAVRAACERELGTLEENKVQRIRSYQTLGLCAGAAVAILFI